MITTVEEFVESLEYLSSTSQVVGFDIETTGTDSIQDKLIGVAYGTKDRLFYLPTKEYQGDTLASLLGDEQEVIQELCSVLLKRKLVMHNGVFDIAFMYHQFNIDLTPALHADTILMKHTLDEEPPFGLKDLAAKYFGVEAKDEQEALKASITANGGSATKTNYELYKADLATIAKYAIQDVNLTLKLYERFQEQLKIENQLEFFYDVEVMPLYRLVTIPMRLAGIPVDIPYFEKLKVELTEKIQQLETDIQLIIRPDVQEWEEQQLESMFPHKKNSLVGKALKAQGITEPTQDDVKRVRHELWLSREGTPFVFNFGSTKHLAWLLFEKYGLTPSAYTDKGSPKVDKNTLPEYDVPFKDKLLEMKRLEKLLGTYVEGILSRQRNGKIYPEMLQFGTTSGRYSCRNPNFQNLVRDDKSIKKGLVAPPGYKYIGLDYSSLEPRCTAAASKDQKMQFIFQNRLDFYSQIAIEQFGIRDATAREEDDNYLKKKYPQLRQLVKGYCLAAIYGASAYRLSFLLNKSPEETQGLLDEYFAAFPGVKSYIELQHSRALTHGKVWTDFGRVRHLPEAREMWQTFGKRILNRRAMIDRHGDWGLEQYKKMRNLLNLSTNHPIQGTAAHVVNAAMIKLSKDLTDNNINGQIVLSVHDSIVLLVKEEHVNLAAKLAQEAMENNWVTQQIPVPMLAEPMIGDNYGDV